MASNYAIIAGIAVVIVLALLLLITIALAILLAAAIGAVVLVIVLRRRSPAEGERISTPIPVLDMSFEASLPLDVSVIAVEPDLSEEHHDLPDIGPDNAILEVEPVSEEPEDDPVAPPSLDIGTDLADESIALPEQPYPAPDAVDSTDGIEKVGGVISDEPTESDVPAAVPAVVPEIVQVTPVPPPVPPPVPYPMRRASPRSPVLIRDLW
ncbi:hypothetical protein J8273_1712 [Carpediemonas membranifera]|uniref:Uncharacterized protein n=1 Tax=Carpediemonas membranifera TaxID=201153 RepID=A0A8J6B8Y7_9EUKA|nr:hypothetical protein J8273_1712 [Carpediemonas membranifera]|eukprot:KAG9396694.1 hypothetical protein J8273_1712 [Carpediemonas membranifera]